MLPMASTDPDVTEEKQKTYRGNTKEKQVYRRSLAHVRKLELPDGGTVQMH